MMLKGMGGSTMGVWCAHGEGRATFPSAAVREDVESRGLAPVRCAHALWIQRHSSCPLRAATSLVCHRSPSLC